MNKPLKGVKVVDCTFFAAGPAAGRNLAEWGADVIKVEPPKNDPGRSANDPGNDASFNNYNFGKRGIIINSKDPQGAKLMDELIGSADVFLTSYRTDALERMGLDWASLHAKFPKLIWAQVNGFGDEGPAAADPGFDTVAYWARSGATHDFVQKGQPLIIPPVAFGDLNTGAVLAGGIAAALYQREKTGEGEKVMISLYGNAIYNMTYLLWDCQQGGSYPKVRTDVPIPVMNSFQCGDGGWIYLAVLEYDRYLDTMVKIFNLPELKTDDRFNVYANVQASVDNKLALTALLDKAFLAHSRDEWDKILTDNDLAHSVIRTSKEVLTDAQAIENNYIIERTMRDGVTKQWEAQSPVKFGNIKDEGYRLAPQRGGQDTREILKELGYSDEQIQAWIDANVVKSIK